MQNIKNEIKKICEELIESAELKKDDILVLGCSSSEINGNIIGKGSSYETGVTVIESILEILKPKGIYLSVQGCEHINRALVIEKEIAVKRGFEIVWVVPALKAGGACALAAYERFENPVMIEHVSAEAGIDIGDTSIGMHVKFVQIPVRVSVKEVGKAHVTCLKSRPKLIGGERAVYSV